MCNNCIHKAVCSIYRATGGVKKCEHFKEERKGKWDDSYDGVTPYCTACGRSHRGMYRTPNFCPNCGADMRGEEDG